MRWWVLFRLFAFYFLFRANLSSSCLHRFASCEMSYINLCALCKHIWAIERGDTCVTHSINFVRSVWFSSNVSSSVWFRWNLASIELSLLFNFLFFLFLFCFVCVNHFHADWYILNWLIILLFHFIDVTIWFSYYYCYLCPFFLVFCVWAIFS